MIRALLRARVAAAAVFLAACARAPQPPLRPASAALAPVRRAWPVMGTLLEVTVWEGDTARAHAALTAARAAVFRVDTLMSVYKPQSDLSVVNRRAGTDTATVVDPETAGVLAEALRVAELSGGALDVTVGPLVEAWGFYRHRGEVPPPAVRDSIAPLVGWRRVHFDPARRTVRLPLRGMRLDFGGIAKGYAVDRGVEALRARGIRSGMVDLGGNFRVFGRPPAGDRWVVGVRDPRDPEEVLATVSIDSGAIATSGDYEQFFVHEGVRYSHIFDPRTRWPSRGIAAVSVIAPTALSTDALSKPFFVLGVERGCALAATLPGVEVVWVRDRGAAADTVHAIVPGDVVYTSGLAGRLELDLPDAPPGPGPSPCPTVPLPR